MIFIGLRSTIQGMAQEKLSNAEFFKSLLGESDTKKILKKMENWPVAAQTEQQEQIIFAAAPAADADTTPLAYDGLFLTGQRTGFNVSESILDSAASEVSDYEWRIQQGLVEFRARVFQHPPKSNQRLMEISFERDDSFDLNMNDLVLLSEAIIPGLLFPKASRPLDYKALLSSTYAFGKRGDNDTQTSTFRLDNKDGKRQLRTVLDSGKLQSVEMSTTYTNSEVMPYRIKLNRRKSLFDRPYFRLRVPIAYQWNEDIAQFLLDTQREAVGNTGLRPSPQGLAETINTLSSAVIAAQQEQPKESK